MGIWFGVFMMSLLAYQHCFLNLHRTTSKIGYGNLVMDGTHAIEELILVQEVAKI